VQDWPHNAQWLNLRWLQARRRSPKALLADEEVWASAQLPAQLRCRPNASFDPAEAGVNAVLR